VVPKPQIYDMADSILSQKISQSMAWARSLSAAAPARCARRIEPDAAGLERHRPGGCAHGAGGANANRPKGAFQDADHRWQISDNDQIFKASDYAPIIAAITSNGAPVRISDLARLPTASPTSTPPASRASKKTRAPAQLKSAVLVIIFKSPGANIISTVTT